MNAFYLIVCLRCILNKSVRTRRSGTFDESRVSRSRPRLWMEGKNCNVIQWGCRCSLTKTGGRAAPPTSRILSSGRVGQVGPALPGARSTRRRTGLFRRNGTLNRPITLFFGLLEWATLQRRGGRRTPSRQLEWAAGRRRPHCSARHDAQLEAAGTLSGRSCCDRPSRWPLQQGNQPVPTRSANPPPDRSAA